MYKKLMYAMAISLLAVATATTQGATFSDNFGSPRDYVKDGVAGTGWDGFLGLGAGETVDALNASKDRPGQLYIASTNAWWQPPSTNLIPPMLYKMVSGDFIATVKVTDFAGTSAAWAGNNNASLMARAPLGAVGTGENWVTIDYFPEWNCGNFVRESINGARSERGHNAKAWNLDPWMQLERNGNVFHFRSSVDGVTWTELAASPRTRNDLAGVALEVGLSECTFSATPGYAAFDNFTLTGPGVMLPNKAYGPNPANEATDVLRTALLSWTPTEGATGSDVYFGTSVTDVTAASRTDQRGVLVSQAQDANTYDPIGVLVYGQTYYWRIDGIDASGAIIGGGEIWSFTVEPVAYAVASTDIKAAASSGDKNRGPELTIDNSGMNGDLADTLPMNMWNTVSGGGLNAWIQYTFDKVYKMQEMWVWNYNGEAEPDLGYGLKDVTIQYTTEADPNTATWTTLGDFVFAQAEGVEDALPNPPVLLKGIAARQIKFLVKSTWNPNPNPTKVKCGLSEVRFFYLPVWAREPQPATGSTNVDPAVTLSWRSGREAASHNVYLGTDANALPLVGSPTTNSFAPAGVTLGAKYYWRVDEVNQTTNPTTWQSEVWDFTTPDFMIVDDMERYDDKEGTSIFNTWSDGYNTTTNGAQVGYGQAANGTFCDTATVHGGRRSMPFIYGIGNITTSEVSRTFTPAQNWTAAGIKTLTLFFHGTAGNATGQLYVKINSVKVTYPGAAAILAAPVWKQWNIDLSTVSGVSAVSSFTIGITGTGGGTLLVDDIRLYRTAPAVVTPVDPGTTNLMAYFTMEGEVKDSTGHGFTGTLNNVVFVDSMSGLGKAAQFNGSTAWVDMGSTFSSGLLKNLTSCSFAVWVNYPATSNQWGRVFDFGISSSSSFIYMTHQGAGLVPRLGIRTATLTERNVAGPRAPSAGWHHLAAVIDASGASPVMAFYVDGEVGQSNRPGIAPKDMGDTTNNWLGRSQFEANGDPYLNASIDELRIYNRVLTAGEISYLVGDR